jgi:hypothetical protein
MADLDVLGDERGIRSASLRSWCDSDCRSTVETAIINWIYWYNETRLHGEIGDIPPRRVRTVLVHLQPAGRERHQLTRTSNPGWLIGHQHLARTVGVHTIGVEHPPPQRLALKTNCLLSPCNHHRTIGHAPGLSPLPQQRTARALNSSG